VLGLGAGAGQGLGAAAGLPCHLGDSSCSSKQRVTSRVALQEEIMRIEKS